MRTKAAIEYFGSAAELARALGVSRQAISEWGEFVPVRRAYELEHITGGRLALEYQANEERKAANGE